VLDRYRWSQDGSYGSTITPTISQDSSTPSSFVGNSMKFTNGTGASPSAGQTATLEQYIEGFNTADLAFGTASAASITLSFWVKASVTGAYCVSFRNSAGSRSMVKEYTINAANTWEQKTITVAGDTAGTWVGATNGIGLIVSFTLGSGATYKTTAGSWSAGYYVASSAQTDLTATTGATWFVTGVQLEAGTTASPFEYRQYGTEYQLCQRYYSQGSVVPTYNGNATATTMPAFQFYGQPMRISPTVTVANGAVGYGFVQGFVVVSASTISATSYYLPGAFTATAEL
jgi:hypothetical protein